MYYFLKVGFVRILQCYPIVFITFKCIHSSMFMTYLVPHTFKLVTVMCPFNAKRAIF